jgi:hypothetical protein
VYLPIFRRYYDGVVRGVVSGLRSLLQVLSGTPLGLLFESVSQAEETIVREQFLKLNEESGGELEASGVRMVKKA